MLTARVIWEIPAQTLQLTRTMVWTTVNPSLLRYSFSGMLFCRTTNNQGVCCFSFEQLSTHFTSFHSVLVHDIPIRFVFLIVLRVWILQRNIEREAEVLRNNGSSTSRRPKLSRSQRREFIQQMLVTKVRRFQVCVAVRSIDGMS